MILEKVKTIIADKLSLDEDEVKLESSLQDDFGADSLDAVEIIMGVEEEFDVEVADEELVKIKTVKDIVDYIEKVK